MSRVIRLVVALLLLAPAGAVVGCGPSKNDGVPNPDLKTPDIPPSGHGSKDVSKGKKQ